MIISACMIAKNEEKKIATCINSYKDAVDEIIVVDTGSSDRTADIARELGATVYNYEWDNNFAKAKNFALSNAKGDWIIFLDADEYFCEQSSKELRNILQKYKDNDEVQGISCKLINIDADKDNKYIDEIISIRIFRNIEGLCFESNIHEVIRINGLPPNIIFEAGITVYHTGYSSVIFSEKLKRNLGILKNNRKNKSKKNSEDFNKNEFYLAATYASMGDYDKVLLHIKSILESGKTFIGNVTWPFEVFFHAMIMKNNYSAEYDKWLDIGEKSYPYQPLFSYCRAYKHYYKKEYSKAFILFEKCVSLNNSYSVQDEINSIKKLIDKVYYFMAEIYELKNDMDLSIEYYKKSLNINKYNEAAFKRLVILESRKETNDVIGALDEIYDVGNKSEMQFLMKQLSRHKIGQVLLHYWKIWNDKFGQKGVYYVMTLMSTNRYQEAFEIIYSIIEKSEQDDDENSYFQLCLVISAMFNPDAGAIEKTMQVVSTPFKKIIKILLGLENGYLSDDEFNEYFDILQEIIPLTNTETTKLFLSVQAKFSFENRIRVCKLLIEWGLFALALECYSTINCDDILKQAQIKMQIGICFFKLSDWETAKLCFEEAKRLGYNEADVFEFTLWANEKLASI